VALHAQCESLHCLRTTAQWVIELGASLNSLQLRTNRMLSSEVLSCLQVFRGRVPCLRALEVDIDLRTLTPGQALDLALEVVALCDSIQGLTDLSLPLDIMENAWQARPHAFSQLPMLHRLSLSSSTASSYLSSHFTLRTGGFHALHTLSVKASIERCADIVLATSRNVQRLHLRCGGLKSTYQAARALRDIAQFCSTPSIPSTFSPVLSAGTYQMSPSNLNAFFFPQGVPQHVVLSNLTGIMLEFTDANPSTATTEMLVPLLSARGLQYLHIKHPYALTYTEDDLTDMLGSWHSIRSLSLNPQPSRDLFHVNSLPPLAILAVVARCGPSLKDFSAMVEGFGAFRPVPEHTWAPGLQRLDLGYSQGEESEDVVQVANYIHTLFPTVILSAEGCSTWVGHIASTLDTLSNA
jgi:hypothetical protein